MIKYMMMIGAMLELTAVPDMALARSMVAPTGHACMNETASISVTLNMSGETAEELMNKLKAHEEKIKGYAKEQGIESLNLQSQNYNLRSNSNNNYGGRFQLSGNSNYQIPSVEKGMQFFKKLSEHNIQANLNVNKNRNYSSSCAN